MTCPTLRFRPPAVPSPCRPGGGDETRYGEAGPTGRHTSNGWRWLTAWVRARGPESLQERAGASRTALVLCWLTPHWSREVMAALCLVATVYGASEQPQSGSESAE